MINVVNIIGNRGVTYRLNKIGRAGTDEAGTECATKILKNSQPLFSLTRQAMPRGETFFTICRGVSPPLPPPPPSPPVIKKYEFVYL